MRDLALLLVIVLLAVFLFSVFTDVMPPAVSLPARGLYNQGAQAVNGLVRIIGFGGGSEYFMLLPAR